ncbi:hypothetical protein [Mycobacteroides abscessus]|uniref:hypothetical protein n=1 Tax=Mycobacteroides abscessus TaxID=36809 RepID=UPI000C25B738|nr:hypothetical protein [Mycobacteroides abscessus]PVB19103.1 hypothetical protein DDJ40_04650 [Mycobacteroides abscessus]
MPDRFDELPLEEFERLRSLNYAREPGPPAAPVDPAGAPKVLAGMSKAVMPIMAEGTHRQVGTIYWDVSVPLVRVRDVLLPEKIHAEFGGGSNQPGLKLTIEVINGVPGYTRIELVAKPGGQIIPRDMQLAKDRLTSWLYDKILIAAAQRPDSPAPGAPSWTDPATAKRAVQHRPRTITAELLREVAAIYQANIRHAPTEAVADALGVKWRTAARYVQLCREPENGFLAPTTQGRKRG